MLKEPLPISKRRKKQGSRSRVWNHSCLIAAPGTYTLARTPGERNMLLSLHPHKGLGHVVCWGQWPWSNRGLRCTNLVGLAFLGSRNWLWEKQSDSCHPFAWAPEWSVTDTRSQPTAQDSWLTAGRIHSRAMKPWLSQTSVSMKLNVITMGLRKDIEWFGYGTRLW